MIIDVKVPQLSESVAEATLVSWHKKAGEAVARDENLIDIETDKVVLELPAPDSGVLVEIVKGDGDTVVAGEVIARIDTAAQAGTVAVVAAPAAKESPPVAPVAAAAAAAAGAATAATVPAWAAVSMRAITSPATTVSPSPLTISTNTPLSGAGNSRTTLSVSMSIRFSSRATASPAFLCHDTSVASATDSESCGTLTSMIMFSPF